MRNNVYICGTGNLAQSLMQELRRHKVEISGVFTRKTDFQGARICRYGLDYPEKGALVFLTVPDRYIGETEKNLSKNEFYAVHTAGSVPLDTLQSNSRGVFYPLQSFSANYRTIWEHIPVLIESNDELLTETLFELAAAFGTDPVETDSDQRNAIHLAAVFANNFSNAMLGIAQTLATEAGFKPGILNPLIRQTIDKLYTMSAESAQTGPAKRGDEQVMAQHLQLLADRADVAEIYKVISTYLKHKYR